MIKTLLGGIAFALLVVAMFLLGINDLTITGYQVVSYMLLGCVACCLFAFSLSNGR